MAAEHETRQPDLHLVPKPAALAAADRAPVSDQTAPGMDNVPQHPVTAESLLAARLSGAGEASRARIAFQLQRLAGNEALQRVVAAKPKPKLTSVKVANAKAFGAPDNYVTTLMAVEDDVLEALRLTIVGAGLPMQVGEVVVTAGVDRDRVEVTVRDTGPGIPSRDLSRIFERFYKVDRSRGGLPGSGLGLSIARHLVELQGGTIVAESSGGSGTIVRVRLPRDPLTSP